MPDARLNGAEEKINLATTHQRNTLTTQCSFSMDYKKNNLNTDKEKGRGTKRARVTRG
jgi:hypothetical protein